MQYREAVGDWRINANGFLGRLQLWMAGNAAAGRLWLDAHQVWEALTAVSFNTGTDELAFTRGSQRYSGKLAFDSFKGRFTEGPNSFNWHAERAWPAEARQERQDPRVGFLTARPGAPTSPRVLVLLEERLLGPMLAASGGGGSPFTRWLDDLQNEGWDAWAYTYDVRSDETGERGHRHLPSNVGSARHVSRPRYPGPLARPPSSRPPWVAAGTIARHRREQQGRPEVGAGGPGTLLSWSKT
jgi:hypothetical protein